MIDDEQWRDELLRALGREPTRDDLLAVEAAVAANQHLRALRLLETVPHDGLEVRCPSCGSYPREAGEPCPMSDQHRELLREAEARLAEALRLLGVARPH